MSDEQQRVPPRLFWRSFLLVVAGYLGCRWTELIVFFSVAKWRWPATYNIYFEKRLTPDEMLAEAAVVFPTALVWIAIAGASVAALLAGWWLFRAAPFGSLGHAVFLALILFVDFLQQSMQLPPLFKWMPLIKMAVYPLAVLIGARAAEWWSTNRLERSQIDAV
jgi:hypothetical protein